MISFTNGLQGVGCSTRSSSRTQGNGQWAENQSLKSCKFRAWGRPLPVAPTGLTQQGWGTQEATCLARARDNRARRWASALPHRHSEIRALVRLLRPAQQQEPRVYGLARHGHWNERLQPCSTGNRQSGLWPSYRIGHNGVWRTGSMN